jgi:hypothetical protein
MGAPAAPTPAPPWPGYALPAASYTAPPVRHTSHTRLLRILVVGLTLVISAGAIASTMVTPSPRHYVCPPDCGRPPIGKPVETNPRLTLGDGQFSVAYPGADPAYKTNPSPSAVVLNLLAGDGGILQLSGEPAGNRTPRQIADALIKRTSPDATVAYEIPNAMVGYQPGYGGVYDFYPLGSMIRYQRLRLLVMVAVKNGLAVIAAAVGPYHTFSPDFGNGSPSGANLEIALDMGRYVNSFAWRGDPPR